jgi:hypothetical protein
VVRVSHACPVKTYHADVLGLVVWAIAEARSAAIQVDSYLTGASRLAQVGGIVKRDWKSPDVSVSVKSVHSDTSSGANSDTELEVDPSQLSE